MTRIDRSALLPFRAEQLFALVSDIESYPQYMDGCVGAEILQRSDEFVEARLDLARAGIEQSFSTRNRGNEPHSIELELIEGPFDHFAGYWRFQPLGDAACKVTLCLEFSMSNGLLGAATGKLFESVAGRLVEALGSRAKQLFN